MPEVTNAADRKQVRNAGRRTKSRERRFQNALRAVMATPEGRLLFGERRLGLLARAGCYRSVFSQNPVEMAYNAGRQDFGHQMMALLAEASEKLYLDMERETRLLESRDAEETAAATAAATTEEV